MTEFPDGPIAAVSSHSHLFPGAVLRIDVRESTQYQLLEPRELKVTFVDGSEARAELVLVEELAKSEPVLIVEAYTTRAGTTISRRMWPIAGQDVEHGVLSLRLGRAMPSG